MSDYVYNSNIIFSKYPIQSNKQFVWSYWYKLFSFLYKKQIFSLRMYLKSLFYYTKYYKNTSSLNLLQSYLDSSYVLNNINSDGYRKFKLLRFKRLIASKYKKESGNEYNFKKGVSSMNKALNKIKHLSKGKKTFNSEKRSLERIKKLFELRKYSKIERLNKPIYLYNNFDKIKSFISKYKYDIALDPYNPFYRRLSSMRRSYNIYIKKLKFCETSYNLNKISIEDFNDLKRKLGLKFEYNFFKQFSKMNSDPRCKRVLEKNKKFSFFVKRSIMEKHLGQGLRYRRSSKRIYKASQDYFYYKNKIKLRGYSFLKDL